MTENHLKALKLLTMFLYTFDPYGGRQAKGVFGNDGYFYDKDSGAKVYLGTNRYVQVNDNWYYVNAEGKILKRGPNH